MASSKPSRSGEDDESQDRPAGDPEGTPEGAGEPRPVRVIAGLGNPGARYDGTRHNVGFRVVEELARRRGWSLAEGECNARLAEGPELILVQPLTYMNRSGHTLRCLTERRAAALADVLVVYDEVHLPLGRLRLRPKGSPAGHRGLESVIESLRTDEVPRLRLGVEGSDPPAPEDLAEYVLAPFEGEELSVVDEMIERAADACETWLESGIETAMNRHNG